MATKPSSSPVDPMTVGPRGLIVGIAAAVISGFLFRYLTVEFANDHYVHLSRAWQIVLGDVPVRDFFDPGGILQYYVSTAGLLWSGHNLFGEALLTIGFIAAGAGLTFLAAAQLSRSFWIGATAAFIGVLSMPRLYNYPKAFVYVLAIVVARWYSSDPGKRTLASLAIVTVVAFLFRHDHGVYIGMAVVALLVARHWRDGRRTVTALAQYGLATLVLLAPFLAFIESTRGLRPYIADLVPTVQAVSRIRVGLIPPTVDWSRPLLEVAPPSGPHINVRWADGVDARERTELERQYKLVDAQQVEGPTWSYVPMAIDQPAIRALINDPAVADTHGIDRSAQRLAQPIPFILGLERRFALLRLRVAPGLLSPHNSQAWFYDATLLTPVVSLFVLTWLAWHRRIDRLEASVVVMMIVLCLIIVQTIVRGAADSRLPDVANPTVVLGAWALAAAFRPRTWSSRLQRLSRRSALLAVACMTIWGVGTEAEAGSSIESTGIFGGPAGVFRRTAFVTERLRNEPLDNFDPDAAGIPAVSRYLLACTKPADRVLVTWFAPQIVFYAERAFAGGQVYLLPGWYDSPADQLLTIDRMRHQRVPIVLEEDSPTYRDYFDMVYEYVHYFYREIPPTSDAIGGIRVLVDSRLTANGIYPPLGLPCYS